MTGTVLMVLVLLCMAYLVLTTLVAIAFLVVGAFENAARKLEDVSTDYATLGASRFTIPVSVIVAAYNEETVIESTVRSFLGFDYPEFEVIVVNDGSSDTTLDRLREAFELEPYEVFVRHVFSTAPVRSIYRSRAHPNLVVVDKENGGKADSWNAALNVARYRYVCGVDADTVFDRRALLKVMRVAVRDPARIVGVTSQITTAREPERVLAMPTGERSIDGGPLGVYQHLDFLRAFLYEQARLVAPGIHAVLAGWLPDLAPRRARGAGRLFDRVHLRGHRADVPCPRALPARGREYRIHCLPDSVGVTESPNTYAKLVSQRERWQRVISETVIHYRHMWFNRRYGSVGFVGAPFYLLTEVVSPAIEVIALATLAVAVAVGLFDPLTFVVVLAAVAFVNATLTAGAILLDDVQSRLYRKRDLARLLLLAPFELVLYRPIIFWARVKGSWGFLRGDKSWDRFARNVRAPA